MYFLDTNALYWYFGRDELGMRTNDSVDASKLQQFLNSHADKALSASAFIEAVVHFRDELEHLEKLLLFIKEKELRLFNNVPYVVWNPTEYTIALSLTGTSLKNYAAHLLTEKIEIEAKFVAAFLRIMSLLYLAYKLDNSGGDNKRYDRLLDYIGSEELEKDRTTLKSSLVAGYAVGEEEKQLKNTYIDLLEEKCFFIDTVIRLVSILNQDDPDPDLIAEIKRVYSEYESGKLAQDNFVMERIRAELKTDTAFLNSAKPQIAQMFTRTRAGKSGFSPIQAKYIETVMFDAWMNRGQKIKKNDIFDMLFIGCAAHVEARQNKPAPVDMSTYLLSFDKTVKRFIAENRPSNIQKIDSFYLP